MMVQPTFGVRRLTGYGYALSGLPLMRVNDKYEKKGPKAPLLLVRQRGDLTK